MTHGKPNARTGFTVTLLHGATIVLGIVLVLTPLALWVAWSEQVLFVVVACGIVATIALLLCRWLAESRRFADAGDFDRSPPAGPPQVSDEFLAELSGMGPFTYHNRLTGDYKFRMKMARLRKLLKPDGRQPDTQQ